jgi:hypothetical protein
MQLGAEADLTALSSHSGNGALRSDHYELILRDIPGEIALAVAPATREPGRHGNDA